jgi:hypothetical protein
MVTLAGASGAFPFAPFVVVVGPACPIPVAPLPVSRATISCKRLTSLSRERTLSRRYAASACS